MAALHLTPEQEAEAQPLWQRLKSAFEREALQLARLMASQDDRHVLGGTEVEGRDQVQREFAGGLGSGFDILTMLEAAVQAEHGAAPAPLCSWPPPFCERPRQPAAKDLCDHARLPHRSESA